MVEIIKRGVPYVDRVFDIKCGRCASQLRFKGDEVEKATDFEYIVCPVCETWLNTKFATPVPE